MRPSIMRALIAAGATAEMLVAAVEAEQVAEQEKAAARREAARLRKERQRALEKALRGEAEKLNLSRVTERDNAGHGVTSRDTPSPSSSPPYPPNNYPTPSDDDLRDASTRAPLIRPEAFALATEIGSLCGHDPDFPPPAWCGAPARVETWLAEGWAREQIIPAVQGQLANKRDGPPASINYFEKGIATFIAKQNQPLPQVQIIQQETVNVRAATDQSASRAAGRILQRLEDFDRSCDGGEPSPSPVRLLSAR